MPSAENYTIQPNENLGTTKLDPSFFNSIFPVSTPPPVPRQYRQSLDGYKALVKALAQALAKVLAKGMHNGAPGAAMLLKGSQKAPKRYQNEGTLGAIFVNFLRMTESQFLNDIITKNADCPALKSSEKKQKNRHVMQQHNTP